MKNHHVTITIQGLGEFQSTREHVAFWSRATRRQLLRHCREWLDSDGYRIAFDLPKHELAIVAAGILHATN